ncbi:hypothetical protein AQ906_05635 [Burkholderia pseudomallei]|nr:hypothetical protein AQ906_05635 [Burkholderia pseudomallei]
MPRCATIAVCGARATTMTLINVIVNRDDRRWTRSRIADAPRAGFERPAGGGRAVRTPSLGGENRMRV